MSAWTVISGNAIDANSPWHEGLVEDFHDNISYNYERALRCGRNAVGVRLALARGRKAFTVSLDATGDGASTVTITYATDATDGDPNFLTSETPTFSYSLEQDSGGGVNWSEFFSNDWNEGFQHFIASRPDADEDMTIQINCANASGGSGTFAGWINWRAEALVASGE